LNPAALSQFAALLELRTGRLFSTMSPIEKRADLVKNAPMFVTWVRIGTSTLAIYLN
jgi:hypothetical protein